MGETHSVILVKSLPRVRLGNVQKYSHLLGGDEHERVISASLPGGLGDDREGSPDATDWAEELEGATVVEDPTGLRPEGEAEAVATAADAKSRGNEAFSSGNHEAAITFFNQAIALAPNDAVLFSNRSAAHSAMKAYGLAEADALRVVALRPRWSKAYSRLGAAFIGQGRLGEAGAAYKNGIEVDPHNETLMEGFHLAERLLSRESAKESSAGRHTFKGKKRKESPTEKKESLKAQTAVPKIARSKLVSFNDDDEE